MGSVVVLLGEERVHVPKRFLQLTRQNSELAELDDRVVVRWVEAYCLAQLPETITQLLRLEVGERQLVVGIRVVGVDLLRALELDDRLWIEFVFVVAVAPLQMFCKPGRIVLARRDQRQTEEERKQAK